MAELDHERRKEFGADWINNVRLLEPIGYVPPSEFEEAYYAHAADTEAEVGLKQGSLH